MLVDQAAQILLQLIEALFFLDDQLGGFPTESGGEFWQFQQQLVFPGFGSGLFERGQRDTLFGRGKREQDRGEVLRDVGPDFFRLSLSFRGFGFAEFEDLIASENGFQATEGSCFRWLATR